MYQIFRQPFGNLKACILKNSEGDNYAKIIPDFGANLIELQLKSHQILDGFKTEEQLEANEKSRGNHLLPFPNRIKDGRYQFEGKEYQLPINKPKEQNAIHGFTWDKPFRITDETVSQHAADIKLEYHYEGTLAGYPFPFLARYRYELNNEALSIHITVINKGHSNMPVGVGWHPYFTFHKPVDYLQLQLPVCNILSVDDRMIPTGESKPLSNFDTLQTIGKTEFDTAFELKGEHENYETRLRDKEKGTVIIIQQNSAFNYLQVYIPPDRKSIALEPMTCPANAFNSRDGLIVLKPGESIEGEISVLCRFGK